MTLDEKIEERLNRRRGKRGAKNTRGDTRQGEGGAAKKKKKAAPKRGSKKTTKKKKKAAPKRGSKKTTKKKTVTRPRPRVRGVDPELFAHAYVRHHFNATEAYLELRPDVKRETAWNNASVALRDARVQRVLAPLLEAIGEREVVNTEWVLRRWYEQSNASPLDYFEVKEGDILGLDLSAITDAQRRNLRSVTISEHKYGRNVRVEVVDQTKAVENFAKYLQLLNPKLADEDLDRIGDLLERGVKRIVRAKDIDAWRRDAVDAKFSDAE